MATIDSIQGIISATVEEAGFNRAEAAFAGIGTAAQASAAQATAALGQIATASDVAAGRYVDAQGKLRAANGQFVSAAQQAAEAAARNGGSLASLGDVAGTTARTINGQLVQAFKEYDKALKPLESGIGRVGQATKEVGQNLTVGLTLPILAGGAAALAAAGKYEALGKGLEAITVQQLADQGVTGLTAVTQAAIQTQQELVELKEIAKAPGIGFEQAVAGAVRLETVGESAKEAEEALKQFANAIALTGGGADKLDLVTVQLAQLSAKGKVLSQDLRPIIEAAPAVAGALQKIFGSIDPEEISKQLEKAGKSSRDFINDLVGELGRLPRVNGGLANSFENLSQTAEQSLGRIGDSISKALDLPDLLGRISTSIEGAADSFAALDPGTQKFIIGLAAAAAAVGPVLVVVGSVLAIIPQVVAGFGLVSTAVSGGGAALAAFATGPVGIAIAAIAALGGGLYYLATAGDRAADSYREQAKATNQVASSVTPLLARYTELSEKVNRSEAEQNELNTVIQQLADLVPGAVTAIDNYGKATGISTKAVTDFTAALEQQKQAQAALALPDAEAKLNRLKTTYESLKAAADQYNKSGTITSAGPSLGPGGGSVAATYKASGEAVAQLQLELANANVAFQTQKGLVDELRGSTKQLTEEDASLAGALNSVGLAGAAASGGVLAGLREQLKALKEARELAPDDSATLAFNPLIEEVENRIKQLEGSGTKSADKIAEAYKKLRLELERLPALDKLLGDAPSQVEVLQRRADVLAKGLRNLIDVGANPASKAFRQLTTDFVNTSQAADRLLTSDLLESKEVDLKLKVTVGDFNPDQLDNFSKELLDHPVLVPFELAPLKTNFSTDLLDSTIRLQKGLEQASTYAVAFGKSFDFAGERAAQLRGEVIALLNAGLSPTSQRIQELNAQIRQYSIESDNARLISESYKSAAENLGNALGEAVGKVAFAGADASSIFRAVGASIIDALADFAEKKGKLLIALGLADLAVPGLQATGALELAGGIALLAAAGVARAGASALSSGGGSSLASSPSSNYSASSSSGSGNNPVVVEFRLRGQDLVGVARAQDYRSLRSN